MKSLLNGRLGRVRYIALRSAILLLAGLVFIGLALLTGILPPAARSFMGFLIVLSMLSALVIYLWPAVRRAHDFNASGWLALLSLVPLVNLIFWFTPGSAGANRHGEAPPANSRGVIASAIVLSLLGVALMLFFAIMGIVSHHFSLVERPPSGLSPAEQSAPGHDPEQ